MRPSAARLRSRLVYSLRLPALITLVAFTAEALIMLLLRGVLPRHEVWVEAMLDSALLVAMLLPALYFFMVRPLELQIAARRSTEERLANLLDTAADAVLVLDEDWRISLFNQGAQQLYGYHVQEVLGRPLDILVPERFRDAHRKHLHDFSLSPETARLIGDPRPVFGRRKDGSEFPAEASLSKLLQRGRLSFTVIMHDITRRKRAEEALRQTNEELEHRVRERTAELSLSNEALQTEIAERERAEEERGRLWAQVLQERERAEALARTVKEERDTLDTIMENTRTHLAYLDPQFNFVRVNSTYARGSGHSPAELIGRNHFDLFPHPENRAIFEHVRDTGWVIEFRAKPFEFPDQPERGVTYWDWTLAPVKDGEGQAQGVVLSLVDVTERRRMEENLRQARDELEQRVQERTAQLAEINVALRAEIAGRKRTEEELRSSEELFRQLAENVREVFWVASPDGRRMIYLSPVYQELWGRPLESLDRQASTFVNAILPEDRPRVAAVFEATTDFEVEFRIARPDGAVRWIRARGFPIRNETGVVYRIAGIAEDVTERVEAFQLLEQRVQERTRTVREQAQHLAALEERQRLARELHDSLSQALYGIALGAHTAREFLNADRGKAIEALDYVLSLSDAGLTEMRALIFDLRPESLEMEGLVNALAKQAAAVRARYDLETGTEFCEEPEAPFETKEAIYRIAQEALHNTVKHACARRLNLRLCRSGETLVLEVSDDGVGFDPQVLYPGHLGLSSMRERAARMGGQLEVHSAPGCGTRVRAEFSIPPNPTPSTPSSSPT